MQTHRSHKYFTRGEAAFMNGATRVSKKRLDELVRRISARDKDVMLSLQNCRCLTTSQIMRLHFMDAATNVAALRAANRALTKLKGHGLVSALARRIGGVRAGSGSYVWRLTTAGVKLLSSSGAGTVPRKHLFEPSPHFLAHTLAVSEAYVRLRLMHGMDGVEITEIQTEPDCWRAYKDKAGESIMLKPDLFVIAASGEYEYGYFLELDLATEAPVRILAKCRRYVDCYRSGIEQRQSGMFPCVVWIVPSEKRKAGIMLCIREAYPAGPRIFLVVTPNEFEALILTNAAQTAPAASKGEDSK
jgi:hypothetical protein